MDYQTLGRLEDFYLGTHSNMPREIEETCIEHSHTETLTEERMREPSHLEKKAKSTE